MIESLLAVLLLFLAALYLLSLFASGHRHAARTREQGHALLLARNLMEVALAAPAEALASHDPPLPGSHAGYLGRVELLDFQGDLKRLVVTVTAPGGAEVRLQTLRRLESFLGIACDPAAGWVVAARPGAGGLWVHRDGQEELPGPPWPAREGQIEAAGVGGVVGQGFVWAVGPGPGQLTRLDEGEEGRGWQVGPVLSPPRSERSTPPRFAGLATDGPGERIFLADRASRGLWVIRDEGGVEGPRWLAGAPFSPSDPPLGSPAGVAVTASGDLLWVADGEGACLRKLRLGPSSLGLPEDLYEPEPGLGSWSRTLYRPPEGMGSPRGVAVNPWGSVVVTVDEDTLWILEFLPDPGGGCREVWIRRALPAELVAALPSGVAFDPYRSVVYLNTRAGQVWKASLGPPLTYQHLTGGR